MSILERERERESERKREMDIDSRIEPAIGMCSDGEWNPQAFGVQDEVPTN